jgi:membrane protease YdiL (CAAX protease family)
MTTIKAFIDKHPLLSFFALAFAISWGGILLAVGLGPGGFSATPQQFQKAVPYAVPAMVLGPAVAGILLTGLIDGRAGLSEFRARLLKWRVGARWYAVALFTAPLLIMGVMLALSLIYPEFLPRIFIATDKASVLLLGIAVGLTAGICGELGWTGFAVPRMRLRYGVLGTGLIVGFMFAAWDFLVVFWMSDVNSTAGALPMAIFLPVVLFSWLPTYRVLMVWVYERTNGSLLLAMLMHASLVAFWTNLTPLVTILTGMPLVIYYLVFTAALWVVIGVVALAQGGHLTREPPLRRRVA